MNLLCVVIKLIEWYGLCLFVWYMLVESLMRFVKSFLTFSSFFMKCCNML